MAIKTTFEKARRAFSGLCDAAGRGETVIIQRSDGEDVAMISAAELRSLRETMHLIRSPANALRLFTALDDVNRRSMG